mgnify:FL=1|jgi:hypothetical protein|tara:strand:+ start:719 stop:913 length:195 start_codon:yes stop_codon:yes gene_type:complete
MKKGNLVRIKQVPNEDAAGNPLKENLAVYLGEEKIYDTIIYDVLVLGETKIHQISGNYWELEKV